MLTLGACQHMLTVMEVAELNRLASGSDPDSGLAVVVWQQSGVTLAFTGDTLAGPAARRSIALEPMEAMTDAFNRDDCVEAITLAAGAERRFHCGLEIHLP